MGRTIERFALSFLALLLLACEATPRAALAQPATGRTPRETIAYVPGAVWGDSLAMPSGLGLDLDRSAIYWYDGSDEMGRAVGDRGRYEADDAKASPRDALVAFVGRYSAAPTEPMMAGVAVMDTAGVLIADFPRAKSYAWSPDGTRLAVVFPREALPQRRARGRRAKAVRHRPGVAVWDRRDGSVRSYARWPSAASWAGGDSLLLQVADSVVALDARRGTVSATGYRGAVVSPDSRYSLRLGKEGENARILDEGSGAQVADAFLNPREMSDVSPNRSAFWVGARGADHLMCVSACEGTGSSTPSCRTEIVDVETQEIVESFQGEAIGPAADGRGVVVFRRNRGRLDFHDLRPVAREREETRRRREEAERHDEPENRDGPENREEPETRDESAEFY